MLKTIFRIFINPYVQPPRNNNAYHPCPWPRATDSLRAPYSCPCTPIRCWTLSATFSRVLRRWTDRACLSPPRTLARARRRTGPTPRTRPLRARWWSTFSRRSARTTWSRNRTRPGSPFSRCRCPRSARSGKNCRPIRPRPNAAGTVPFGRRCRTRWSRAWPTTIERSTRTYVKPTFYHER